MKLKVQKYNPLVDAQPYYVEGEVEYREGITALDAIYLFHTTVEPVNFDYSCGGRVCGRCGAKVDGQPKLMCFALLDDGDHTIEPLDGYDIIRDLVVDKSGFDRQIAELDARVQVDEVTEETLTPADFDSAFYTSGGSEIIEYMERCARCGICASTCPVLAQDKEAYVGPAGMVQIGLKEFDWYDKGDRIAQAVSAGLYRCIQCGMCDEVCMMQVPHLRIWEILRARAEERGLKPSYAQ